MKRFFACILCMVLVSCGTAFGDSAYAPLELNADQLASANLFLSNFTETGVKQLDAYGDDMHLVDFAHDHMWFNDNEAFEYGEYENGNNCRVSDDRIQAIIDAYFYYPKEVDVSQTRYDYIDGYYYGCETGGFVPDGFAHVVSICPIDDSNYFVSFMVFGGGSSWNNEVMDWTLEEAEAEYGHPNGYGSALIHADDLSERDTYRLINYGRI